MWLFSKKNKDSNEKDVSYVLKCDDIESITELSVGSIFSVSVSNETNDVIVTLPNKHKKFLETSFTIEEDDGNHKTAKLSVRLTGKINSDGDTKSTIILPKLKTSLRKLVLSGAAKMDCCNIFNPVSAQITTSGVADLKADIYTKKLGIEAAGSSSATLTGEAHRLYIITCGSTKVDVGRLICRNAFVETNGCSSVVTNPSHTIAGSVKGASSVEYGKTVAYDDIRLSGIGEKRAI